MPTMASGGPRFPYSAHMDAQGVRAHPALGDGPARARAALTRAFDQQSRFDRWLTATLAVLLAIGCVAGLPELLRVFPASVDLESALRAASQWAGGTPVYPPSAMQVLPGPDQPFLYPPYLLPPLVPIAAMPHDWVAAAWLTLNVCCAVWALRRLAVPWLAVPFFLGWLPFAEALIAGNVQILSFAAFVALLYARPDGVMRPRDLAPNGRGAGGRSSGGRSPWLAVGSAARGPGWLRDTRNGVMACLVGAFKVAQALPVLFLARRRLRSAVIGVSIFGVIALATLPLTGISIWGDWIAQLQRASSPAWRPGGMVVGGRLLGIPDIIPEVLGVVLALAIRGRHAAAWLGIVMIVSTPSAHGYTFLFLIPALLTLRRDVAFPIAAAFLAVYRGYAWWLAVLFTAYFLVASTRWPWLLAQTPAATKEPVARLASPERRSGRTGGRRTESGQTGAAEPDNRWWPAT